MFRWVLVAVFALVLAACDQDVTSADRETSVNTIGTIREIDKDARTMVLRIEGRTLTILVPERITNFALLETGDRVRVQYQESLAVRMALPSEEEAAFADAVTLEAPEDELPGSLSADVAVVAATFLDYDQQDKRVWLELADGTFVLASVPRELRSFARARSKGDQILISNTSTTLISVEPAS